MRLKVLLAAMASLSVLAPLSALAQDPTSGQPQEVVIDQAEIPAFQERLRLDLDEDGDLVRTVGAFKLEAASGHQHAAVELQRRQPMLAAG